MTAAAENVTSEIVNGFLASNASPADGVHSVCLSVIDCVGAVTMIPAILFGATPPRLSSVAPGDASKTVALVARAS